MASNKDARSVIDLNKYLNRRVRVKFNGGREVMGVLKGHDAVSNLVLDETQEFLRHPDEPYKLLEQTRSLGLIVARGTAVVLISPVEGTEEIDNPFVNPA